MKELNTDFLTNQQRIKFIFVTLPILNFLIIAIVTYTSSHPLTSLLIGLLTPLLGGTSISIGRKTSKGYFFVQLAIVLNGLVAAAFCAVAGPGSPAFIIGLAYIGACAILLQRLSEVLLFISIGFIEIVAGSVYAGKSALAIVIGMIILTCYAVILVRFLQFIMKQGIEIVQAKELIEEKNKSITDSINYALRIQQAKLPEKQKITEALPQSFVLFKPKDIVSGDFYFFHQKNNSVYIAAADCTGHGVPGALMSMIGLEKLESTLLQQSNTSAILQQVNKEMKASLKQTDSDDSTRDGMDIALCCINTQNRSMQYAGANRPVWIIRKGASAIEETKATKKAIGGLTPDDQHFITHEFQLQPGDTFYIFSDGFADTFGGATNKKLTTKKFRELLLKIQDYGMREQENYLNDFIEEWKAGTEQVDDILVIGVRM